jgi:hypothetical protein
VLPALAVAAVVAVVFGPTLAGASIASGGPAPESNALEQNETMPTFYDGHVVGTEYEQGFFLGTTGGTPRLGVSPTIVPTTNPKAIDEMYVIVPDFGPASNPLAPAFHPAAFGISVQCLPATQQVCFDHPANISVPGKGVIPLPAHDHVIPSQDNFQDIWWPVIVVFVTDRAAWPSADGSSGINSVAALDQAEANGQTSSEFPTNIYLDFAVLS